MYRLAAFATAGLLASVSAGVMAFQITTSEEAWGGPEITPTTYEAPGIRFVRSANLPRSFDVTPVSYEPTAENQFRQHGIF